MDNKDPVDVIELGSRQRPVGSITAVKMLGDGWVHVGGGKTKKTVKRRIRLQNAANMIKINMVFTCVYSCKCLVGIFGRTGSDYTEYPDHMVSLASLPMMACHISLLCAFDFADHK